MVSGRDNLPAPDCVGLWIAHWPGGEIQMSEIRLFNGRLFIVIPFSHGGYGRLFVDELQVTCAWTLLDADYISEFDDQ